MIRDRYPDMTQPTSFDESNLRPDDIKLFGVLATEVDGNLSGYLRTGGCVTGCGACCTAFVLPIDIETCLAEDFQHVAYDRLQAPVDPRLRGQTGVDDWERWLNLHDTTLVQLPETLIADLPVICDAPDAKFETEDEYAAWLETLNVQVVRHDGQRMFIYVNYTCDWLTDDGLCEIKGKATRPLMCEDYPRHPNDIQGLNFCTYIFTPVEKSDMQRISQASVSTTSHSKKKSRKKHGRRK